MSKRILSLFSGCGGMDLGFDGAFALPKFLLHPSNNAWIDTELANDQVLLCRNSFEIVFANDIVKAAKNAWIGYFSKRGIDPNTFHLDSIVNLVKNFEQGRFSFPEKIDVVTGGFPCQDFSVAGKRKGFQSHKSHTGQLLALSEDAKKENRGQLYQWMKKVISITEPKVFIAENVKGLVSLRNAKETIEADFSSVGQKGYMVMAKVLFAPDYGIPQSRERIFFIGFNRQYLKPEAIWALKQEIIPPNFDPFPTPTHKRENNLPLLWDDLLLPYPTLRSLLIDLPEPEYNSIDLAQSKYSKAKYCGKTQGQIEVNLDGLAPTIRAEHHGNIEYRRLSRERGGRYLDELAKGWIERRLTVRECARIQTFPDDYEFVRETNDDFRLGASSSYKLIGNAVPPFLAYHFAKRLEMIWHQLFIDTAKCEPEKIQLVS
ncbi:cytosine-specific modification DNA methylase [Gloeomargarita lithophora Alchichica-D10]|uniref:Cytosine-specific methyltransferase n=1 Tax=Gloeomargarita lithophora Alchichica-D10 TaxID=1188229 RepID=A0A1J0ABQ4_9CYAN|nr:DNA (cytosine-5-)-methyltransferase [Gloeomargarita lithophora]APB33360.1 cytosine-specific modification DNA methylase [Gloeomargarita lithophora Alchichica-D10]